MMVGILKDGSESLEVLNIGFDVVAAAVTCIRFFWVDPDWPGSTHLTRDPIIIPGRV